MKLVIDKTETRMQTGRRHGHCGDPSTGPSLRHISSPGEHKPKTRCQGTGEIEFHETLESDDSYGDI